MQREGCAVRARTAVYVLSTAIATSAFASGAAGQPALPQDQSTVEPGTRVTLDEFIGVVGGRPITRSAAEEEYLARLESQELSGGEVTTQEKMAIWNRVLTEMTQDRMLAHGALILGIAPREEIEAFMQRYRRDEERKIINEFGSLGEVVRELEQRNQTLESFLDERVEEMQKEIARSETVNRRFQGQRSLFVSMKERREFFRNNQELYVHGPTAELEVLGFTEGNNGKSARERAAAAAEAWRQGGDAMQLATEHDGLLRGPWKFSTDTADGRAPVFGEFAFSHEEGEVSDPVESGGAFWVLRVLSRTQGQDAGFESREVQDDILDQILRQYQQSFFVDTLLKSQRMTYIWPPDLLGR